MKLTLRLIGISGLLLFGLAFALTFLSPIHVERAARGFIEARIETEVNDRLGIVGEKAQESGVASLALALAQRHDGEMRVLRAWLAAGLNAQIVATVGRMQDLDCDCRQTVTTFLDATIQSRLSQLERGRTQLVRIIEGRYRAIVRALLLDLRIFTGSNLLAFLLLLILSFAKPHHQRQLFVPAVLLGASAVTASVVYLFGQNWFFTLLYGDFVGWAYGVWLLLIFALFCDIALFKARVTTSVTNLFPLALAAC